MRLTDLEPRWVVDNSNACSPLVETRRGMGVGFWCPHCQTTRLVVWFVNPIDGGPPFASMAMNPRDPGEKIPHLWQRTGETLETMSLSPSIDASTSEHWHGFITNGEVR